MGKYKNIFIDLDDTIYDFAAASRESFEEVYTMLGYERFFNSFNHFLSLYEPHNLELWALYGEGKITKAQLNSDRYSYPLRMVGIDDQELADTFCREVLSRIPTKNKVIPGAIELLEYLYPKYDLYILSNGFKELQEHKMETAGLRKYFKRIVLSEDIGINKPHPELFIHALQVADATCESYLGSSPGEGNGLIQTFAAGKAVQGIGGHGFSGLDDVVDCVNKVNIARTEAKDLHNEPSEECVVIIS